MEKSSVHVQLSKHEFQKIKEWVKWQDWGLSHMIRLVDHLLNFSSYTNMSVKLLGKTHKSPQTLREYTIPCYQQCFRNWQELAALDSINEPISNLTNLLSQITNAGIKSCGSVTSGEKKNKPKTVCIKFLAQSKYLAWHHPLPSTTPMSLKQYNHEVFHKKQNSHEISHFIFPIPDSQGTGITKQTNNKNKKQTKKKDVHVE